MDIKEIGKRLKMERENHGLTQAELSREFKVGRDVICRYEKGAREIPLKILIAYAERFNVTTDYLLGLTNAPQPPKAGDKTEAIRVICDYTGLSTDAAQALSQFKKLRLDENILLTGYLSDFICSNNMLHFICCCAVLHLLKENIGVLFDTPDAMDQNQYRNITFDEFKSLLLNYDDPEIAREFIYSNTLALYKSNMWTIQDTIIEFAKTYCDYSASDLEALRREIDKKYQSKKGENDGQTS